MNTQFDTNMNIDDQLESQNLNMIEEFMNLSDEENKIILNIKDEFSDMKVFNYGALVYIQPEEDIGSFPHVSELLENYEKLFSVECFKGYLVFKLTKYYITSNDGLVILCDNGMGDINLTYKIKNVVIMFNDKLTSYSTGRTSYRILTVLKHLNLI